jgi:hypothetical protein
LVSLSLLPSFDLDRLSPRELLIMLLAFPTGSTIDPTRCCFPRRKVERNHVTHLGHVTI